MVWRVRAVEPTGKLPTVWGKTTASHAGASLRKRRPDSVWESQRAVTNSGITIHPYALLPKTEDNGRKNLMIENLYDIALTASSRSNPCF